MPLARSMTCFSLRKRPASPAIRFFSGASAVDARVYPIAISSGLMGCAIGIGVPIMPLFAQQLDIGPTQLGVVIGVMGATKPYTCIWFGKSL